VRVDSRLQITGRVLVKVYIYLRLHFNQIHVLFAIAHLLALVIVRVVEWCIKTDQVFLMVAKWFVCNSASKTVN